MAIGHPPKEASCASAALNISTDRVVESEIKRLQLTVNGLGAVMKRCCDGWSIREVGVQVVEGREPSRQMPRFVQRTILFQLPNEARERFFEQTKDGSTFFAKNPKTILLCRGRVRRSDYLRKRKL